jgi:hypothetical protein
MAEEYFSDRELGPRPRSVEEITPKMWRGIVGVLELLIKKDSFGLDFPETSCGDGEWTTGTDRNAFISTAQLEIPDVDFSIQTVESMAESVGEDIARAVTRREYAPPTPAILDLLEFCHRHVAQANQVIAHSYFGHNHYIEFDREGGQESYRSHVNGIFARNALAYELRPTGAVERLAPPVLRESLRSALFQTGENGLDELSRRREPNF